MRSGTIVKSEYDRTWSGPKGEIHYHNIAIDNGDVGSIGSKDKSPDFLEVGQKLDYEISDGKYGKIIKRSKPAFTPKGGKQLFDFDAIKRMTKSNALSAIYKLNSEYEDKRFSIEDAKYIEEFTLYDISGDIEKWGKRHDHLITRMSAINIAVDGVKACKYRNITDLIAECKVIAKYLFT